MSVDVTHMRALHVHAADDQVAANVTHVSEEVVREACHYLSDPGLTSSLHTMQSQLPLDHLIHVVTISSGTCSSRVDIGCDVMQLETVLLSNDRTTSSSCVCGKNDAILRS